MISRQDHSILILSRRDLVLVKYQTTSAKKYYVEAWKLYLQPIHLPNTSHRNIASASLFLYPERAEKGQVDEYRGRVSEYLKGIKRSLDFIKTKSEWAYRMYVDYSIVKGLHHTNQDIQEISASMMNALETYRIEYAGDIELIAVRCLEERSSFLASLWRFLPLFDPNVTRFLCSEADNPFNSLYLYLADTFWKPEDKYMMISPDTYGPPHCLIRVAMDIESNSADKCFIAQNWGGKKIGKDKTIENPALFTILLEALEDEQTLKMWSSALHILIMRQAIISMISKQLDLKKIVYSKSWDITKKLMIESIQKAGENLSRRKDESRSLKEINDLFALASTNRKIAGFIAMMIFPSLIQPHIAIARHVKKSTLTNIVPIVSKKGYGIDEWLLHLIYDESRKKHGVSLIRSNSPEHGLTLGQSIWLQVADNGNVIKLLSDLVSDFDPPFGEYCARTIFFLKAISPASDSNVHFIFKKLKNDYFYRLYLLAKNSFEAANIDYGSAYKLFDSLFHNDNFEHQAFKKAVYINDIKKFQNWIKHLNVYFDQKTRRFSYSNKQGFFAVKNIFLKGLFCEIKSLHIFKFSDDLSAQSIPW